MQGTSAIFTRRRKYHTKQRGSFHKYDESKAAKYYLYWTTQYPTTTGMLPPLQKQTTDPSYYASRIGSTHDEQSWTKLESCSGRQPVGGKDYRMTT
jgi:hypothetical protein